MKTGDVVKLKSGGPKMTVAEVGNFFLGTPGNHDDQLKLCAKCQWFVGTELMEDLFELQSLVHSPVA